MVDSARIALSVPFFTVVGMETVRYLYRLRPGGQAERALLAEWGRCRWL